MLKHEKNGITINYKIEHYFDFISDNVPNVVEVFGLEFPVGDHECVQKSKETLYEFVKSHNDEFIVFHVGAELTKDTIKAYQNYVFRSLVKEMDLIGIGMILSPNFYREVGVYNGCYNYQAPRSINEGDERILINDCLCNWLIRIRHFRHRNIIINNILDYDVYYHRTCNKDLSFYPQPMPQAPYEPKDYIVEPKDYRV